MGYYGFRGDEDLDESGTPGGDFLADVTQRWETEALKAEGRGVRVALMRFGIVLAAGGGALGRMRPLFRLGLGGRLGSGRQWFSWIHRRDLARAVQFLFDQPRAAGAYNFSAPGPIQERRVHQGPGPGPGPSGLFARAGLGRQAGHGGNSGRCCSKARRSGPPGCWTWASTFDYPAIEPALRDILAGGP